MVEHMADSDNKNLSLARRLDYFRKILLVKGMSHSEFRRTVLLKEAPHTKLDPVYQKISSLPGEQIVCHLQVDKWLWDIKNRNMDESTYQGLERSTQEEILNLLYKSSSEAIN